MKTFEELKNELSYYLDEELLILDGDSSELVTFKCGGRAALVVKPQSLAQLFSAMDCIRASKLPFTVIGNGSNVLVKDSGYEGVIVRIGEGIDRVRIEGRVVFAESGCSLAALSKAAGKAGLSGLEFASGIPGTLGGAVFMNAGAYGGEMKDVVIAVNSMNSIGMMKDRKNADCDFSYRHSIFMEKGEIVLGVKLLLNQDDPVDIEIRMRELAKKRKEKQPLEYPSAGSFFKRPEGSFAGKLIEDAGLKGLCIGGAQISELHAGFILNTGNACASDILDLMDVASETVFDKFHIRLEPEVRILG